MQEGEEQQDVTLVPSWSWRGPLTFDLTALLLQEVLNMLKESKADIFVDPVLHTACALDIKHQCAAIPPGKGRRKSTLDFAVVSISG